MSDFRNLKIRLQDRNRRLCDIRYDDFVGELGLFFDFLRANSYTASLLEQIETDQEITLDQWANELPDARFLQLPKSETARAKICLGILTDCLVSTNTNAHYDWANQFGFTGIEDQVPAYMVRSIVDPFTNYLFDRIDDSSNVLYLLQRFKSKAEWFRREQLNAAYIADPRKGEKGLDAALRESLFDGGIDYPFSQPASPSGKADIVASPGSEDPLVLEVKVYDPKRNRRRGHIRQGLHQAAQYAKDYNESVGYLVVFNCSAFPLSFRTTSREQTEFPPRVSYEGKTIYLISIDIGIDGASASKENPASRTEISYEELTG
ncbi:MAG: hypothetical protein OXD50_04140 [Chloroflexi bacterium]|nr:hypothetical protein [Chloroflexota bacterium]